MHFQCFLNELKLLICVPCFMDAVIAMTALSITNK